MESNIWISDDWKDLEILKSLKRYMGLRNTSEWSHTATKAIVLYTDLEGRSIKFNGPA